MFIAINNCFVCTFVLSRFIIFPVHFWPPSGVCILYKQVLFNCLIKLMWCNWFVKLKRYSFMNTLFFNVRFNTHCICTYIIFIHICTKTVISLKIRNNVCWDLDYDNAVLHTIFKWSEHQYLLVLKFGKKTPQKFRFFKQLHKIDCWQKVMEIIPLTAASLLNLQVVRRNLTYYTSFYIITFTFITITQELTCRSIWRAGHGVLQRGPI